MYLEMKNITMQFGSTLALDDVDFGVERGEIHGLMGENGAGKSTLMNILGGVLTPKKGEIIFDGHNITGLNEKQAARYGIRFIHQELNLINDLKVYENLFLGDELTKGLFTDRKRMLARAAEVLKRVHLEDVHPNTIVGTLDTSHKQLIEIAKALLYDANLIIMDEPTTALSENEIKNLFEIMRRLKVEGVSMIYISHKMPELFEICDRFTVLRDGKVVGSGVFAETTQAEATTMLVGQHISDVINKESHVGDVVLRVEDIACGQHFRGVSFALRRGEVLAFTGLQGDGRGELAEALFGVRRLNGGSVWLGDRQISYKSVASVMRSGIGMVQRNRKERSIIRNMSVLDNLTIADSVRAKGNPFISSRKRLHAYEHSKKQLNIKVRSPKDEITALSGGNQQKVIISRWLTLGLNIYIFDNPTQGVDVGAKFEIYKLINQLASGGVSVIVFSSEYPEIAKIADRCAVMYGGEIVRIFDRDEFDETTIMHYATGASGKAELA